MSQKVEAIKSQIKYQKVVLKKNPEDKNLLKFSTEGNKLTLNQLLSNFRILANISISSIAVSDESALENGACNTEVNKSSLTIKTVEERENFMMQQREKILKKIQELKSKRNVVSERRKSESKKRKGINEPYNSKSCKRKCTKSVVSEPDHFADHKFSKGETVAIAYSDGWYPGQVEEVLDNTFATVKCLHPLNSKQTVFCWPVKDDIIRVENIFIFSKGFEFIPNDSSCRTWKISDVDSISSKYSLYKSKYF